MELPPFPDKIPDDLFQILNREENAQIIDRLVEKFELDESEVAELSAILGCLVVGVLPFNKLVQALEENLNLESDFAKELALGVACEFLWPLSWKFRGVDELIESLGGDPPNELGHLRSPGITNSNSSGTKAEEKKGMIVSVGRGEKRQVVERSRLKIDDHAEAASIAEAFRMSEAGRANDGIAVLDKALQLNPEIVEGWYVKGLILEKAGRKMEALSSFDRAIGLDNSDERIWFSKGVVLEDLGRKNGECPSFRWRWAAA